MSNRFGIGAMIMSLGGNEDSVATYKKAVGKTIKQVRLMPDIGEGALQIDFTDGTGVYATDGARSCCESRYMNCDDDLTALEGAVLTGMEVLDGPDINTEYGGPHEVQFLRVITDRGSITCSSHNEHNGYYGGISLALHEVTY